MERGAKNIFGPLNCLQISQRQAALTKASRPAVQEERERESRAKHSLGAFAFIQFPHKNYTTHFYLHQDLIKTGYQCRCGILIMSRYGSASCCSYRHTGRDLTLQHARPWEPGPGQYTTPPHTALLSFFVLSLSFFFPSPFPRASMPLYPSDMSGKMTDIFLCCHLTLSLHLCYLCDRLALSLVWKELI